MMLFIELFLILFAAYSLWLQYASSQNSFQLLIISFSLLAFFYLLTSFYQIFIGILSKTSTEGIIKVMSFCTFSVAIMGMLFKINGWPGSSFVLTTAGISMLVLVAVISMRNRSKQREDPAVTVSQTIKSVLSRLIPYLVVTFFFVQISVLSLYKHLGTLKNDPKAIDLLEKCHRDDSTCKLFIQYQNEIIQKRNANKTSATDR